MSTALANRLRDFAIESLIRPDDSHLRALNLPRGISPRPDEPLPTPAAVEEVSPEALRPLAAELARQLGTFDAKTRNEAAWAAFAARHAASSPLAAESVSGKQAAGPAIPGGTTPKPQSANTSHAQRAWVSRRFG